MSQFVANQMIVFIKIKEVPEQRDHIPSGNFSIEWYMRMIQSFF